MSTDIDKIENTGKGNAELNFRQFWGGQENGTMIQLTQGLGELIGPDEPGFIQLTVNDAYLTINILTKWIKDISESSAKSTAELIRQNKELEKTILQDVVECERFIRDLEILRVPLTLLGNGQGVIKK